MMEDPATTRLEHWWMCPNWTDTRPDQCGMCDQIDAKIYADLREHYATVPSGNGLGFARDRPVFSDDDGRSDIPSLVFLSPLTSRYFAVKTVDG